MLTAIFALLEFGLSLTGQQAQLVPPSDSYTGGTPQQRDDRLLLQMLHDSEDLEAISRELSAQDLCDQLLCRASSIHAGRCRGHNEIGPDGKAIWTLDNQYRPGYESLAKFTGTVIDASGHPFPAACVLTHREGSREHRILITPDARDASAPYGVYSCLMDLSNPRTTGQCSFEKT